jgi:hypothetical protein
MLAIAVPAGLSAVASCRFLRGLTVGSFNLVRPVLGRQDLRRLEHLSFGGGFANKGLHLLFPLLDLKSLHITVRLLDRHHSLLLLTAVSTICHTQHLRSWGSLPHASAKHRCRRVQRVQPCAALVTRDARDPHPGPIWFLCRLHLCAEDACLNSRLVDPGAAGHG